MSGSNVFLLVPVYLGLSEIPFFLFIPSAGTSESYLRWYHHKLMETRIPEVPRGNYPLSNHIGLHVNEIFLAIWDHPQTGTCKSDPVMRILVQGIIKWVPWSETQKGAKKDTDKEAQQSRHPASAWCYKCDCKLVQPELSPICSMGAVKDY